MKTFVFTLAFIKLFSFTSNAQGPSQWISHGIGGGGALFAPSISRDNPDEIYMGCDMTELFHSTDQGGHWSELPFTQIQGGHDSQVQFTSNPNTRYCVDYSTIAENDLIRPMKSTDGGLTWNILSGDPYPTQPNGSILRLFADYHNANNLVIADYGTIYFSNDGGNSFTQFHTCISNNSGNHIAGVFFDGDSIYVGTNDGLLYTTNGGTTWNTMTTTGIPGTDAMLSFAGAVERDTLRLVCLTSNSGNVYAGITYGDNYYNTLSGIYTMDNDNGTWVSKLSGISIGNDFPVFVGMAENDIDTIYCAGGSAAGNPIVMRSIDSGSWQHVFLTTNNQNIFTGWAGYQGDHQCAFPEAPFGFQVCPNNSRMVIFTTYSDTHITTDAGNNWYQKYLDTADENPEDAPTPKLKTYHGIGLENTSCWSMMWYDSLHIFSSFTDIAGVMSTDGGSGWQFIPNIMAQNTTYRMVKHPNGNIYACTSNTHDMYQTTHIYDDVIDDGTGAVWVSTNTGNSFTEIKTFNGPTVWVEMDPTDTNRMYVAVANSDTTKGGVWRTRIQILGASATWLKCTSPPRTQGHAYNIHVLNNGDLVVSFSARKPTSGSSFTASAGVFYSTDKGVSWSDRTDPGMQYYTTDVMIDPNDTSNSTWYAGAFQAWGSGVPNQSPGLYKTVNKGISWQQIVQNYHVNSCTINPSNPDELWMTTESDGLFISDNINSATPTFSLVNSYPFRHAQRIFFNPYNPNDVWAASFGNGMMNGNLAVATTVYGRVVNNLDVNVYPNPAVDICNVRVQVPLQQKISVGLFDMQGQKVNELFEGNISAGIHNFSFNSTGLAKGIYMVTVISGEEKITRKMVL